MTRLSKSPVPLSGHGIVYGYEGSDTLYVQPDNQCLSCHPNPHATGWSANTNIGVGINTPIGNAGITVDDRGRLSGTFGGGLGLIGGVNLTYNPSSGPPVAVQGGTNASPSSLSIATASADNTRVGR